MNFFCVAEYFCPTCILADSLKYTILTLTQCIILRFISLEYDFINSARILPTFRNAILPTSASLTYSVSPADGVYEVSRLSR
jgi:hypothetical protein